MKNDDLEAEELLRQMGRLVVPLLPPEREALRHERMVLSVNRLVRALPVAPLRGALRVRAFGAVAAAAAGLALLFGGLRYARSPEAAASAGVARVISVTGNSTLSRLGGSPSVLIPEQHVEPGDEVRTTATSRIELALTGAGRAQVAISEGTRVSVNQRTAEAGAASEDWLDLREGLVALQVEKLSRGLVLAVQTPDARVTVHGTRFSVRVEPRPPSGSVTSVAVTEGLVQVDSRGQQLFLGPGQQWSSQPLSPEALPTQATNPQADSAVVFQNAASPRTGALGRSVDVRSGSGDAARPEELQKSGRSNSTLGPRASAKESTLAEENRLYAQALAQANSGDLPLALSGLSTLIRDYPRSPLAQSAQADRVRLLEQTGNKSAAAQEARRYLSAYPNGFARAEAHRIALIGIEAAQ